jgi:hypothetical protein
MCPWSARAKVVVIESDPHTASSKMLSIQGSPYAYDRHPTSAAAAALEQRSNRKRKADAQDNERLSKRLGRLNLGQNLRRLYATVEDDVPPSQAQRDFAASALGYGSGNQSQRGLEDHMQMDDSKHKVYIFNIDDELSSSESEAEDGRLIFLPDIEKALRANRIPSAVRANSQGQLAGTSLDDMQLVLYKEPSSLTVAPEHDSVRKAILEARERMWEKQKRDSKEPETPPVPTSLLVNANSTSSVYDDDDIMDLS